jgi:hypothetical protein
VGGVRGEGSVGGIEESAGGVGRVGGEGLVGEGLVGEGLVGEGSVGVL